MKLKALAVAVAASFTFPMVAQADLASTMSIDGDIGVFYVDSSEGLNELGTEINFDGSAEQDGVTYMGHMELDVNGGSTLTAVDSDGNDVNINQTVRIDEVRVGAKGGFGEVWLGEVDNACDQFDPGSNDIWLGGQSGSCGGSDVNNIVYKNKFGNAQFAVSHNPNADQSALGVKFGAGPVSVNLGYEDLDGTDQISYGVAGSWNGLGLNIEGNDNDVWGANATYSMAGNTFWLGYGDNGGPDDRIGIGYRRSHGKMDYIIEHQDHGSSDETIVGLRYRF